MDNVLPPLVEKYGDQLEITYIDAADPAPYEVYLAAIELFDVPLRRQGVPALYLGDTHLVGTDEIEAKFDGEIEKYLQRGGIDYPPIPGLAAYLSPES